MEERGRLKKYFPGNNTAYGFYSFYDYIIEPDATRIFVIKGGPGVGKSSFMKNIGEELLNMGFDVEMHCCSSDNDSLDGVVIPKIRVALIDGTAPHVVDPKNPGGVDEILNLGEFWDESKLRIHKYEIINYNKEIGRLFNRAYNYLRAAKNLFENIENANKKALDFKVIYQITENLITDIFKESKGFDKWGKERHLFASAITPDGVIEYMDTLIEGTERIYTILGDFGTGKTHIMKEIGKRAQSLGYYVEYLHLPLLPEKLEHIIIPELSTVITTFEKYAGMSKLVVDLNQMVNKNISDVNREEREMDREYYNKFIEEAVKNINGAKKTHDEMEKFYIESMNFEGVDSLRKKIIERILRYAEEMGV